MYTYNTPFIRSFDKYLNKKEIFHIEKSFSDITEGNNETNKIIEFLYYNYNVLSNNIYVNFLESNFYIKNGGYKIYAINPTFIIKNNIIFIYIYTVINEYNDNNTDLELKKKIDHFNSNYKYNLKYQLSKFCKLIISKIKDSNQQIIYSYIKIILDPVNYDTELILIYIIQELKKYVPILFIDVFTYSNVILSKYLDSYKLQFNNLIYYKSSSYSSNFGFSNVKNVMDIHYYTIRQEKPFKELIFNNILYYFILSLINI